MGKRPWETPRSTLLAQRRPWPASVHLSFIAVLSVTASAGRRPARRQLALPFIVAGALVVQTPQLKQPRVRKVDRCGGRRPSPPRASLPAWHCLRDQQFCRRPQLASLPTSLHADDAGLVLNWPVHGSQKFSFSSPSGP